jgi:hypothetical protein
MRAAEAAAVVRAVGNSAVVSTTETSALRSPPGTKDEAPSPPRFLLSRSLRPLTTAKQGSEMAPSRQWLQRRVTQQVHTHYSATHFGSRAG